LISNYFNEKLKTANLFDQIIFAFKINNKPVELARTTHEKTHSDFIKCTLLPMTTEICFLDNSYFSKMKKERVYYIQPTSYIHSLSTHEIVERLRLFGDVENLHNIQSICDKFAFIMANNKMSFMEHNPLEFDIHVSQKMMYHLKEFFYFTKRKQRTKKWNLHIGKFTRKKRC